jgi:DNA-binding transcriptional ArsR family regulator
LNPVGYLAILPNSFSGVNMNSRQQAKYKAKAKIIKALAHPTRLFIVDELSKGERCVCELKEMVGADVSTVSKHLSVLKDAGLVTDDKRGMQVYYDLKCKCITQFFNCVEAVLMNKAKEDLAITK